MKILTYVQTIASLLLLLLCIGLFSTNTTISDTAIPLTPDSNNVTEWLNLVHTNLIRGFWLSMGMFVMGVLVLVTSIAKLAILLRKREDAE